MAFDCTTHLRILRPVEELVNGLQIALNHAIAQRNDALNAAIDVSVTAKQAQDNLARVLEENAKLQAELAELKKEPHGNYLD